MVLSSKIKFAMDDDPRLRSFRDAKLYYGLRFDFALARTDPATDSM
jgi:hypothetical protein